MCETSLIRTRFETVEPSLEHTISVAIGCEEYLLLATTGGDHQLRFWELNLSEPKNPVIRSLKGLWEPCQNLLSAALPFDFTITSIEWSPDRTMIAVLARNIYLFSFSFNLKSGLQVQLFAKLDALDGTDYFNCKFAGDSTLIAMKRCLVKVGSIQLDCLNLLRVAMLLAWLNSEFVLADL